MEISQSAAGALTAAKKSDLNHDEFMAQELASF